MENSRGLTRALNSYNSFKDLFGDSFVSSFEEYHTLKKCEQKFICSDCGSVFNTTPYHYRDGMTRCKNCVSKYKSEKIRSSDKFKEGIKRRDSKRVTDGIDVIKNIWSGELEFLTSEYDYTHGMDHPRLKYRCLKCGHVGYQFVLYLRKGPLYGSGCSNSCHRDKTSSTQEQELKEFFISLGLVEGVDFIQHCRSILKNEDTGYSQELDFYFPNHQLAVEFNGDFWHSYNHLTQMGLTVSQAKNYHYNKTRQCEDRGIHLIHIWQHEWCVPAYQERIKSILKGELGLTKNRIYARKCTVQEVSQEEYRAFVSRLSILRFRNAKHRYGLYYNGSLVMVMGVDYCQSGKGSTDTKRLEIVRSVTELDTIIVGGTSKLLKHITPILNNLYPDIHELVYFVDYDKHLGKSLLAVNAIFDGYTGPSGQNYCIKDCTLVPSVSGTNRVLKAGHIYSRLPAYHKSLQEHIDNGDVLSLYSSGTKRFHFNI